MIYLRVSTDEQVSSGAGLGAQEAECRRYAEVHGWTVLAVVTEEAVSGKVHPSVRPGFGKALELLDACEAGTLLVRRQDRVSRRLRHFLDVLDRADGAGWSIATTDGLLDTSTASGGLSVHVMASVAEYERKVIGERTRDALAVKRAQGVRLGGPQVIDQAVVDRIVRERAAGLTLAAIADLLTAEGVPTAKGGVRWWPSTIRAVLSSQAVSVAPA